MKKIFIFLVLISAVNFGCSGVDSANSNSANANAQTVSDTQTNQQIVAKTETTPLPVFTDANEALAAGDKLFDASNNEKAIEAYRQAVALNPDFAEAYFKLGMAYSQLEIEQEQAGIVTEPEPTPTATKKGKKEVIILSDADKAFENAVKAYKKILDENPKDDVAQFNLGRAYNKLNQDTDAQKALSEAAKLKPEDGQYQTELGAILIKLAQYEEAVAALKKAVAIDAENLQAQDLLEKAQAGKKRIDFGIKPKLEELARQQQLQQSKKRESQKQQRENANSQENPAPKDAAAPEKKNANQ